MRRIKNVKILVVKTPERNGPVWGASHKMSPDSSYGNVLSLFESLSFFSAMGHI